MSEWFPPKERGLVIGIYTAGATLGATLAPPLIAFLGSRYHWRTVFLFTGSLGLLWVIPWLWLYRRPEEHPRLTEEEKKIIAPDARDAAEAASAMPPGGRWRYILTRRETWLLMIGRMVIGGEIDDPRDAAHLGEREMAGVGEILGKPEEVEVPDRVGSLP